MKAIVKHTVFFLLPKRGKETKKRYKNRAKTDKNTKKKKYFQLFRQNTCTVHFFDILLQRQNGKTTFLDTKTSLERWQSGRLHRS